MGQSLVFTFSDDSVVCSNDVKLDAYGGSHTVVFKFDKPVSIQTKTTKLLSTSNISISDDDSRTIRYTVSGWLIKTYTIVISRYDGLTFSDGTLCDKNFTVTGKKSILLNGKPYFDINSSLISTSIDVYGFKPTKEISCKWVPIKKQRLRFTYMDSVMDISMPSIEDKRESLSLPVFAFHDLYNYASNNTGIDKGLVVRLDCVNYLNITGNLTCSLPLLFDVSLWKNDSGKAIGVYMAKKTLEPFTAANDFWFESTDSKYKNSEPVKITISMDNSYNVFVNGKKVGVAPH